MGQGTPTALLMIAAEELDMSLGQMKPIFARHERDAEPGLRASAARACRRAASRPVPPPRRPRARCSTSPRRTSASRRRASPSRTASSPAAARPSPTAQLIGDKLFNVKITGFSAAGNATTPAQAVAGSPGTKPVSQYTIVGTSPPRIDIPDKVTGKIHLRPQHPGPGHAARPRRAAARPGRLRRRHGAEDPLGRRELDQAHRGRAGRSLRRTSSASSPSTEYAAIQAAAQLKVKWADMPAIAGLGQPLEAACAITTAPARRRRGSRSTAGNFDSAFKSAPSRRSSSLQVPLHRASADRPVAAASPT